jgi:TPR repeat protein
VSHFPSRRLDAIELVFHNLQPRHLSQKEAAMRKRALAIAMCLLAGSAFAAPAGWLEIKSAHFTIVTNANEKSGRKIAWQFEQIRAALLQVWPWAKIDSGKPFVVVAAKDEATLKTLAPQYWEGKQFRPVSFGVQGRDRQFVALRVDVKGEDNVCSNPYQQAFWSYTNAVFTRSFPRRLPAWYSRGMTEVMSNTIVRENEVLLGCPLNNNLRILGQRTSLVPLDQLLTAQTGSRWLTDADDVSLFDAQAWALVHYLMFADKGAHTGRLDAFTRLLYDGADSPAALERAFGDMRPYHDGMRGYVQRNLFTYGRLKVALETPDSYSTRPLSEAETAVRRGELLAAMGRPVEARALAAEAGKLDATLPGPWEIEADLLDRENQRDQARAAFAKAAAAGSKRAHVYYRLAQLDWAPKPDKALSEKLAASLEKARELEPTSAAAHSFLAEVRLDLGQVDEALTLAKRAVDLEPAGSYHRMALARALWRAQRVEEAARIAKSALEAASDDNERRRAQDFLEFLGRASKPQPPPSAVVAPSAPQTAVANARAATLVGECILSRDDRACREAAPILEASCKDGSLEACRSLGSLYDGGFGVKQDKARAAGAYTRACDGGDPSGCARLAVLQAQGQGVARDPAAVVTLQRLCGEGVDDACIGWALILATTSGKPELAKARSLLQASCDRQNAEACRFLSSLPQLAAATLASVRSEQLRLPALEVVGGLVLGGQWPRSRLCCRRSRQAPRGHRPT